MPSINVLAGIFHTLDVGPSALRTNEIPHPRNRNIIPYDINPEDNLPNDPQRLWKHLVGQVISFQHSRIEANFIDTSIKSSKIHDAIPSSSIHMADYTYRTTSWLVPDCIVLHFWFIEIHRSVHALFQQGTRISSPHLAHDPGPFRYYSALKQCIKIHVVSCTFVPAFLAISRSRKRFPISRNLKDVSNLPLCMQLLYPNFLRKCLVALYKYIPSCQNAKDLTVQALGVIFISRRLHCDYYSTDRTSLLQAMPM